MYETIVGNAKLKLGIAVSDDDAVLALYARDAVAFVNGIRAFVPTPDNPFEAQYEGVIEDMTVEAYERRGTEGQVSNSTNGVSRTYVGTHYSPDLVARVSPIVRVR